MILGIDASNIRGGGGVTHLVELLKSADPARHGFSKVIVWGGKKTLILIEDRPWLQKSHQLLLDKSLPFRIFWQCFKLSRLARKTSCNVLFVPGSLYMGNFYPMVTLSQNLLPFEWEELRRYGWSFFGFRLRFLRRIQSHSFCKANGVIFLTHYAHNVVMQVIKTTAGKTTIVPHGIDVRFFCKPREHLPINRYSFENPYHILYVSIINVYKHQWHVAEAVAKLRRSGLPVVLEFVGPAYPPALKKLKRSLGRIDPANGFVRYAGAIPYDELPARYAMADLCVFASSCENMPNILLEGMASGLPVACSNRGPMPEVLGDAGLYFNPEEPQDIARAIKELIDSPALRAEKAKASFEAAQAYSWSRCADETFAFISSVVLSKDCKYGAKSNAISFHENLAEKWDHKYVASRGFRERFNVFSQLIRKYSGADKQVFDLGCGTGILSFYSINFNRCIYGFDASQSMISMCNKKKDNFPQDNIDFYECDISAIKSKVNINADLIIASSIFEYFDNLEEVFCTVRTYLNDDGIIIVSLPNSLSIYRAIEASAFKMFRVPRYFEYVKSNLPLEKAISMLVRCGYKVLEAEYFTKTPFLPKSLKEYLLNMMYVVVAQKNSNANRV